jgi:hypothetical protein
VRTIGIKTATRFTRAELGAKPDEKVYFKVNTIDIHGVVSRTSGRSPIRQFTNEVPAPDAFAATYLRTSDVLTMHWKVDSAAVVGRGNVLGYEFEYIWPGTTTWAHFDSPIVGATQAAFSLANVPSGGMTVRIRSIGWPGQAYSEWTTPIVIRK